MEEQLKNILNKLENKKIIIEKETYAGGCAAVPTYIVTVSQNGKNITRKTLIIEDAIDDILSELG